MMLLRSGWWKAAPIAPPWGVSREWEKNRTSVSPRSTTRDVYKAAVLHKPDLDQDSDDVGSEEDQVSRA
jgi:hypothetical protein